MRINPRVSYLDGSAVDTATSAADLIKFEERFDRSVAKLDSEVRFTDLAWLAWHSIHRTKRTALDFDEWVNELDTVGFGEEAAEIVPLETSPSIG